MSSLWMARWQISTTSWMEAARFCGLLWQFRKGFTNISSQPLDFSRIDLGLKISNFDALESRQPRTEQSEVDPKKRRRIDCDSSDAEAVSREQRTSGDHPELPEVLEHKLNAPLLTWAAGICVLNNRECSQQRL